MSKFGALIDVAVPVLFNFYSNKNSTIDMHNALQNVVAVLGDSVKIIKIDVEKNSELAEVLRVKGLPTLMIYKDGEMKWRQSGKQDTNTLVSLIEEYV